MTLSGNYGRQCTTGAPVVVRAHHSEIKQAKYVAKIAKLQELTY